MERRQRDRTGGRHRHRGHAASETSRLFIRRADQARSYLFFGVYRTASIDSTVDRSPLDIQAFQAFRPDVDPNDLLNELYSHQPFGKVTTKVTANHEIAGVIQYDRMRQKSVRSNDSERITRTDVGGGMYGVSLQSVWSSSITTKLVVSYNDKRGNDVDSYEQALMELGPTYAIHQRADQNTVGFLTGSGSLLNGGYGTIVLEKSSYSMIRGDLTWYKQGWGGSHEFQTGYLLMPHNEYQGRQHRVERRVHLGRAPVDRSEQHQLAGHPVRANVPNQRADPRQPVGP